MNYTTMSNNDLIALFRSNLNAVLQQLEPSRDDVPALRRFRPKSDIQVAQGLKMRKGEKVARNTTGELERLPQRGNEDGLVGSSGTVAFDLRVGRDRWAAQLNTQVEKLKQEAKHDRLEGEQWAHRARWLRRKSLVGARHGNRNVEVSSSLSADEQREEAIFLEAAEYHAERCYTKLAAAEVLVNALNRMRAHPSKVAYGKSVQH